MNSTQKAPTTKPVVVLAAVDDTPRAAEVLRTAGLLARALVQAELHVLRVVEPPPVPLDGVIYTMIARPDLEAAIATGERAVEELAKTAASWFGGKIVRHIVMGQPANRIIELAESLHADVVVVGSHGHKTFARRVLGSVSGEVVNGAPCSVLVARPPEELEPAIEPPCPDCVAARENSGGAAMWCARHSVRHPHGELHYESAAPFSVGSMFIRPPE